MPIYPIALELTILLSFWLWLGAWQRERGTPGRGTFGALAAAAIIWCLGDILHQREGFPELIADRIRYVGILALPPLWLGLAAHATRLDLAKRVPWFPLVLLAPLLVPYGLMYLDSWGSLFMQTVDGGPDIYGPLWWLTVVYGYTLIAIGCALFLGEAVRWQHGDLWIRRFGVGVAPLIPLAVNTAYLVRGMRDPIDPTPLFFGVALIALRSALYQGSLLQALPISQHDLIEQMPIGVMLTDRAGAVIDLNPAAETRLAVSESAAIGRNFDAVLRDADADLSSEVTTVFSNGREVGKLVMVDPPDKASGR